MMSNCSTTIENQLHTGSPENDLVINKVQALLLDKPSSTSFCAYFNPIPLSPFTPALAIPNGTLTISSPRPGQVLQPGSQGIITASGTNITEINMIVEYSSTEIVAVKTTGASSVCTAPVGTELGTKRVIVTGRTATGGYVADTTYFVVGNVLPVSRCESKQSGDWRNPYVWSCGREPTSVDAVVINPGHTITITSNNAQAQRIIYNGGKLFFTNASKLAIKKQ
jgi:hypothetical protein